MAKQAEATLLIRIKEAGKSILDRIVITLGDIINIARSAANAIVGFAQTAIREFHAQESAVHSLNQSLVQQGIFTSELSKRYQDMATALQATTNVADDQIIASQALIQGYIGQKQITQELMQATIDFAAAKKVDLATAADLVGKTIGTETNALARYGVAIKEGATETERMAAVVQQLNGKFGGQAAAATKGLGALNTLKVAYNEIMELIGERLAPIVIFFATKLIEVANAAQKNKSAFDFLSSALVFLAERLLFAKFLFDVAGNSLGVMIDLANALSLALRGELSQAAALAGSSMKEAFSSAKTEYEEMLAGIKELDDIHSQEAQLRREEEIANVTASETRKGEIIREQRQLRAEEDRLAHESGVTEDEKRRYEKEAAFQEELAARENLEYQHEQRMRMQKLNMQGFQRTVNSQQVRDQQSVYGQIETLSSSHNKALAAIGKAAAIANIIINTSRGISLALASFPWPFSIAIAGLVGAAGAAQIATVSGVKLAEGGIVRATPGGINATIGEGGKDEAVIPLDDGNSPLGNTVNITVNGGLMGDMDQARTFAKAIDKELLKLRQNNESVSFDSGVV